MLLSQVRLELWNRNGREIWASTHSYESVFFRTFFKDLDIFILQAGCVLLGASEFFKICFSRFELDYFNQNLSEESKKMVEEFFRFLVLVATDRSKSGASDEVLIRYQKHNTLEIFFYL